MRNNWFVSLVLIFAVLVGMAFNVSVLDAGVIAEYALTTTESNPTEINSGIGDSRWVTEHNRHKSEMLLMQLTSAGTGAISGTVTDGAKPLEDIRVHVYDTCDNEVAYSSMTDANGNYTLEGLATGSYKVKFEDDSNVYLSEWYDNKANQNSATAVSVTAPNTTANINAVLAKGGAISGTVTDGAKPLEDIRVYVYDTCDNEQVASASTDANGNYTMKGLATGSYNVKFWPNNGVDYITQWYDDKSEQSSATVVSVTAPNTTANINAILAKGGTISGTVTDGTKPLQYISVYAYDDSDKYLSGASTDANGNYTLKGLATGSYKVIFNGSSYGYISQWYDNKAGKSSATFVSVTAPNTTANINAVLAKGGAISGTVTDGTKPLQYISVYAYDDSDNVVAASTDANGNYTMKGLATGSYKVKFDGSSGSSYGYISQWYDNKAGKSSATVVSVTAPNTTANINAVLAKGGAISGTVTDGTKPLRNIYVYAYDAIDNGEITGTLTRTCGNYTLKGLATGSYNVKFNVSHVSYTGYFMNSNAIFSPQWYDNKSDQNTATAVSVTAPNTTVNIDAVLNRQSGTTCNLQAGDNNCAASVSTSLVVHIPVVTYSGSNYWLDLQYNSVNSNLTVAGAGAVSDVSAYHNCTASTLTSDFKLHIPVLMLNNISYWADFQHNGTVFVVTGAGQN